MENEDKTTFSLDNSDDEIVEEEVIDRDEEYDDDEDYDEEPEEEEEEEEDYDDEEEDYDDGYNDDYYDDRLNKVLDEIAEIKRGMSAQSNNAPAPIMQAQAPIMPPPQYVYQPSAPPAGSEVVMYNEISRLRDELAKNQSNLEMQKELSRLKDDMARDQKFAESQYNAEIRRLQDRIDDLLKNAQSPQDELPPAKEEQQRLEGGNSQSDNQPRNNCALDFERLLSVNEAILRATKETDSRVRNEIAALKKDVDALPSAEALEKALSSVGEAAKNADGANDELFKRISEELESLKNAISEIPAAAPATTATAKPATPVVVRSVGVGGDVSSSELLRQLYEIKNAIGSASAASVKHTQTLIDLIAEYKKVSYDVRSTGVPFKDKLNGIYAFSKKLTESNEPDAVELIESTNELIDGLAAQRLTRDNFSDVASFFAATGSPIPSDVRESAERFFGISEYVSNASLDEIPNYLSDLVTERNIVEENRREEENNELVNEITAALFEENRDEAAIKDKLALLTDMVVGDIAEFSLVRAPRSYKPSRPMSDESIFTKLEQIKEAIENFKVEEDDAAEETEEVAKAPKAPEAEEEEDLSTQEILLAIDDLKQAVDALAAEKQSQPDNAVQEQAAVQDSNVAEALEEIRNGYIDISERLVEISEKIAEPAQAETEVLDETEKEQTIEDLIYIRAKLDERDALLNQIPEIRNDILNISSAIDVTEQVESLVTEMTSQFDKLYEDISNVLIESETNIINRIGDNTAVTDAVEAAKTDILADTQTIKDSLVAVSDALVNTEVADAVEQLRADLSAFADLTATNVDASATDRQKLLDDVAFLRAQAEAAIAEKEQAALTAEQQNADAVSAEEAEREKLYAYLDDINLRITQLAAVPDDLTLVKDNTSALLDTVTPLSDSVLDIADTVNTVSENVVSARDAAVAALDALAPITEQLNTLYDKLCPPEEEGETTDAAADEEQIDPVTESLAEIKEGINTVLDTLPLLPQSDDLITARDNTYSILDTLTMMPQNDDVVATRDNVAAILDAVTALTESLNKEAEDAPNELAEEVAGLRDTANAILDSIPETLAEDVATVRDTAGTILDSFAALTAAQDEMVEDVKYIRQKLDEEQASESDDSIANIVQDIGLVLDRLEAFEQSAANNKQEIVDAVSDIREEIHINELQENIAATGIDEETRDALVGEISEIRDRLNSIETNTQSVNDATTAALDNIAAQLADLQNAVAAQGAVQTSDGEASAVSADSLQAITDELSAIREKIDTESEYDTVEEILSLREDVKAARIVDQNEVSGELEAIKNELAAISSGNILDEIRALRDDIASIGGAAIGEESASATNGELNLVLNEIVSLRDEMFAFKDEVLNATAVPETETADDVESTSDDVATILDEITALRADQSALTGNIDELKDIVSRRTSIAADSESESVAAASNELNVVLGEIINLKNDIDRIEQSIPADRLDGITDQVNEIRALIDDMRVAPEVAQTEVETVDLAEIKQSIDNIALSAGAVDLSGLAGQLDDINTAINDLRLAQAQSDITDAPNATAQGSFADELAELRNEIAELREENVRLRRENEETVASGFAELRDAIRDMALSVTPTQTADGDTSYAALIDEIRNLKEQVAAVQAQPAAASLDESTLQAIRDALSVQTDTRVPLGEELADIRDEIAQLRSLTTVTAESGSAAEVAAIKNELADLKETLTSSGSLVGLAEDVTSIRADVQTLKEEPDLGVMSEILALRDEFQSLREEIEDVKNVASKTDSSSDEKILGEVQSLRDQLFAISMANVNDSVSGESNYESYNNLILDEIASLRDQMGAASSQDDFKALSDDLAKVKSALEKRDEAYDALAQRVSKLDNDATNNKILDELGNLREELANQRDADLTTLNFMSEMAHLLERQNNYISQNAGTKISDEIESLKAEIASTDAVAEELAKLREIMTRYDNASDNESVLNELAELREELSDQKPSKANERILSEISRLRDELAAMSEREQSAKADAEEDDLKNSLSDLKTQLNEIAGIVEPEKKAPAKKSNAKKSPAKSGAKSGSKAGRPAAKNGSKSGGTRKRNAKAAEAADQVVTAPIEDDFNAKIDDEISKIGGDDDLTLDMDGPMTPDALEIADKLAQQVANKLVMEQLVEQLGDGGVSDARVEEIVKDILPQEFSTIAISEQSDKVRKLANRLVLNKLRERLNGRSTDKNDK